ncbi:MAG: DnaJ domain-containing protein [Chloroflexales bacterium]|nr:DnaJ domain-containing protein [Chloroflexales bacterium]
MPIWRYVYGIISTDEQAIFEVGSIDGHGDVYTIDEGGLAVVTSDVDNASFQGLGRTEAIRFLSAHQRVLETVRRDYTVLPVKFGTTLPDEARLRVLLRHGADLFRDALKSFAGKEQYEVVVLWDVAQVFQLIAADERIVAVKQHVANLPPEQLEGGRVLLGQLVHGALQERRKAIATEVLAALHDLAEDTIENPLMDDSMVSNMALLIDEARAADLDEKLSALDERFAGKLQIRCVGPLPPYSFATLEVQPPPAEAVEDARLRLGLDETTSALAIKSAYRRLAARAHPDHNPDNAGAGAAMEALTAAYKLLAAVAQAQAQAEAGDDCLCHLDREAVESTLLLNLKRQEIAL